MLIVLTMFKGRTVETKKKLYTEIIAILKNSPRIDGNDNIIMVIHELELENWDIRGGKFPNKATLEYKIDI